MGFFSRLKEQARKDPKVIVLPELGRDKDGVIREALAQVREEGTAIPIGLTPEIVQDSGKLDEFIAALAARKHYGGPGGDAATVQRGQRVAQRVVKKLPVELFYAAMMVEQGYADGVVAGRYLTSADAMMTAKLCIGERDGQIVSSIFFREPPKGYPLFELIACADMVVNQCPTAEELYRIIVTSATTFEGLTGIAPRIALLSYITGAPQAVQVNKDPVLQTVEAALELYRAGGHAWPIGQAQFDAAVVPDVARKKGAPFTDRAADILIGPSLMQANPIYKALDRLIVGGSSMFVTQGFNRPIMDLSRGDSAANIANVIAACSVQAQAAERRLGARPVRKDFLRYAK